jgi:hypothetical protein
MSMLHATGKSLHEADGAAGVAGPSWRGLLGGQLSWTFVVFSEQFLLEGSRPYDETNFWWYHRLHARLRCWLGGHASPASSWPFGAHFLCPPGPGCSRGYTISVRRPYLTCSFVATCLPHLLLRFVGSLTAIARVGRVAPAWPLFSRFLFSHMLCSPILFFSGGRGGGPTDEYMSHGRPHCVPSPVPHLSSLPPVPGGTLGVISCFNRVAIAASILQMWFTFDCGARWGFS